MFIGKKCFSNACRANAIRLLNSFIALLSSVIKLPKQQNSSTRCIRSRSVQFMSKIKDILNTKYILVDRNVVKIKYASFDVIKLYLNNCIKKTLYTTNRNYFDEQQYFF